MAIACPSCGHANDPAATSCVVCTRALGDAADDAMLGKEILGTYRIEAVLGRGGMAVVYRGKHLLTEQDVAIKVLPPELAGHAEVKARFIEEARTLARLEHGNIVQLYNFKDEDGHLYLVMQFAEGDSFDAIIEREGRVTPADVVALGIEVLSALEYAHARGVIHRDIKPSNIILRGDSSVKVMDFGIAKIVGRSKLTQTGQTMGTVRYMSPEQVRGKGVDHRSDLYSLGITLYEALCGQPPFDGESHFDIMKAHLTDLPPPPADRAQIPPALNDVLLKVLEKRPENRYQSAQAFRHALQRVPVDQDSRTLTKSVPLPAIDEGLDAAVLPRIGKDKGRVDRRPMLVAVLILIVAGGAVVWALLGEEKPRRGASITADGAPTPRRPRWPAVHHLARSMRWKVDVRDEKLMLRVLAQRVADKDAIIALYRRARGAYRAYLKNEGLKIDVSIGPLNVAVVSQTMLNSREYWPTTKADVDYPTRYEAPTATLYVHGGKGFAKRDLPFGLALHFCARIPDRKLSNQRCEELAEGFETFLARGR